MSESTSEIVNYYSRLYQNHDTNNKTLYLYLKLSQPIGILFWLYFALFNIINLPFMYFLFVNNTIIENIIIFLGSIIISDFLSGLVHIYLDNSKITYSGKLNDFFKIGFQVHHLYPLYQWTTHKHFQPHYEANTVFFLTIILSIINIFTYNSLIICYILYLTILLQINHYWSHAIIVKKKVPVIVNFLQEYGILLHYKKHMKHHSNYDTGFSFLNGWSDPIFNYIFKNKTLLGIIIYILDFILD